MSPRAQGPNKGRTFDLEQMMSDYWQALGWHPETGVPTPETIRDLGLDALLDIADNP
ncbi:MAG: aldehyde ferredoxin oxidoreductase C-terminal domain-containing protein [Anaerolineae bacterium]|jgi:aldehyde:ferredoxin oxidoreductase